MKKQIWEVKAKFDIPSGRVNKDLRKWAQKAYLLNKETIDDVINRIGIKAGPEEWFVQAVTAVVREQKITPKEAVQQIGHSVGFVSREDVNRENLARNLTSNADLWNIFKKEARIKNKNQFDIDRFEWIRHNADTGLQEVRYRRSDGSYFYLQMDYSTGNIQIIE